MRDTRQRRRLLLAVVALLTVMATLLTWGLSKAQEMGQSGAPLTAAQDSVGFSAQLQAEEKPSEVLTRWAQSTVFVKEQNEGRSLGTGSAADGVVITEPEPEKTEAWEDVSFPVNGGNASFSADSCVYGGEVGAADSCGQGSDVVGASITDGDFSFLVNFSLLNLGLDAPAVNGSTRDSITTSAQCRLDENKNPEFMPQAPTGDVHYGTGNTLGLISSRGSQDISTLGNGESDPVELRMGSLLLGYSYAHATATPRWGISSDGLSAFSEVEVSFRAETRALLGLVPFNSGWHSVVFRSECGFTMSGDGSRGGPMQPSRLAIQAAPESIRTSATGIPKSAGFSAEEMLDFQNRGYHLLATRELDSLDRLVIEEALAEIAESGKVEGANWKVFDAVAAGELVPVIEIELDDGAIVQVRPMVEGAVMPSPDLVEDPATTTASTSTPAPQPTAPSSTRGTPTPEESTTVEEPTAPETLTTAESLEPETREGVDE